MQTIKRIINTKFFKTKNTQKDKPTTCEARDILCDILSDPVIRLQVRRPAGEHVGEHVFGYLRATHTQGVARIFHLPQALTQSVQFLGDLVGSSVANVRKAVVDFPQEAAELKRRIHIAIAHTAYAHSHQLARQVSHTQQVVGWRNLEGQHTRAGTNILTTTLQHKDENTICAVKHSIYQITAKKLKS